MNPQISKEEVLIGDETDMMLYLAQTNDENYNLRKVVEESLELGEAMMKYLNKHPNHPRRPSKEDIVGELSDVFFRGTIALQNMFPEVDIEDLGNMIIGHVANKIAKFKEHIRDEKYEHFI